MAEDKGTGGDGLTELNAKAEKFGTAYAAFSEGFSGRGMDRVVGAVKVGLAAFVVFVIGSAIWASL